jgi:hypothetical protein
MLNDSLFIALIGKMFGTVNSCGASNFNGFLASLSGNWSSLARLPRLTAARPNFGGGLIKSNQALE